MNYTDYYCMCGVWPLSKVTYLSRLALFIYLLACFVYRHWHKQTVRLLERAQQRGQIQDEMQVSVNA